MREHPQRRGAAPGRRHQRRESPCLPQRPFLPAPPIPGMGHAELNDVSCTSPTACTAVGFNARLVNIPFAAARP